jgi:hypothetical protein
MPASVLIRFEAVVSFLPLSSFFVPHRDRLGHRVLASFLQAVAEARSPQRSREESAAVRVGRVAVRFMSRS